MREATPTRHGHAGDSRPYWRVTCHSANQALATTHLDLKAGSQLSLGRGIDLSDLEAVLGQHLGGGGVGGLQLLAAGEEWGRDKEIQATQGRKATRHVELSAILATTTWYSASRDGSATDDAPVSTPRGHEGHQQRVILLHGSVEGSGSQLQHIALSGLLLRLLLCLLQRKIRVRQPKSQNVSKQLNSGK